MDKELELLEFLAKYPTVLHPGDYVDCVNFHAICVNGDDLGNAPPFGFLWLRKDNNEEIPVGQVINLKQGKIVGAINIVTYVIYPIENIPKIWNVPDMAAVVRLYHDYFPPKKLNILQKTLAKLFRL